MALNPNMPVTIRSVIVGDAPGAGPEWLILTQPAADCHFVCVLECIIVSVTMMEPNPAYNDQSSLPGVARQTRLNFNSSQKINLWQSYANLT